MTSSYNHSIGVNDTTLGPDPAELILPSLSSSRLYHIYHTTFVHDYLVADANKRPIYRVDNSVLTPRKPDLTFHAGEDTNAPIAGVCKFLHFSRHSKLGLGDPQQLGSMVWEDLTCLNIRLTEYRWQMSVPTADGGLERRDFLWKRTHSVGVDGETPFKLSTRNKKLVDEQTGQVVAVFTSTSFKSFWKNGKLQVCAEYGPDFDTFVLITLLAICEKQRRRNNSNSGGG